jgi:hypothetical protein
LIARVLVDRQNRNVAACARKADPTSVRASTPISLGMLPWHKLPVGLSAACMRNGCACMRPHLSPCVCGKSCGLASGRTTQQYQARVLLRRATAQLYMPDCDVSLVQTIRACASVVGAAHEGVSRCCTVLVTTNNRTCIGNGHIALSAVRWTQWVRYGTACEQLQRAAQPVLAGANNWRALLEACARPFH